MHTWKGHCPTEWQDEWSWTQPVASYVIVASYTPENHLELRVPLAVFGTKFFNR